MILLVKMSVTFISINKIVSHNFNYPFVFKIIISKGQLKIMSEDIVDEYVTHTKSN